MDMVVYFSKVENHLDKNKFTAMRIRWCQPLPEGRTPDPDREWAFWDTGPARGSLQEGMVDLSEARTLWDTIKSNGYNPIHPSHLSFGK